MTEQQLKQLEQDRDSLIAIYSRAKAELVGLYVMVDLQERTVSSLESALELGYGYIPAEQLEKTR